MRKVKRLMTIPQLKRSMDRRFKRVDRRFADMDRRFEALERLVIEEAETTRRHFDIVAEASDVGRPPRGISLY